jgi:hypothetical protein
MLQWAITASLAGTVASPSGSDISPPTGTPRAIAPAGAAERGEIKRLSEEIEQLAARNAWPGVERSFRQLQALGGSLDFEAWVRGAQAARSRGDIAAVRDRLIAAREVGWDPTVDEWLGDIEVRFGHAVLRADPSAHLRLECDDPPMDPDLARAIAFARDELGQTGTFDGLLPVGLYRVLDTRFGVTARLPADVDLRGARIAPSRRRVLRRAWREDAP